ncbi:MAG TPA: MBL fold metallo-hydrolase [Candidatus Dojkabacteria bacterium]|nr:MBL fold metallo-hydrolase [Candidatus Dojkabacteria bacterium]
MKIKYLGFTTIQINAANISLITEPNVAMENGVKINSVEADIVLNMDDNLPIEGVKASANSKVLYISNPGEYESKEVMIQRPMSSRIYIVDEDSVRLVYIGSGTQKIDKKLLEDLGDVDILVLPVGVGELFPSYEDLEAIISKVEPSKLVPVAYSDGKVGAGFSSVDDFIKHFGYANTREETTLKVESSVDDVEKAMEVIILKK